MMKKLPSFQYFHNSQSSFLDVVMHGKSEGMESRFIQKVISASRKAGNSTIAFNFPYLERGDDKSSGPELEEEIETLKGILRICRVDQYKRVNLIGKSFGGIVASYFLKQLSAAEQEKFSIIILGYVTGYMDLKNFRGRIVVIQGQKDKFGGMETVRRDLEETESQEIKLYEIPQADHSYRDEKSGKLEHEGEVIEILSQELANRRD
jgi:predicted alpha/beta-hydrolase family hydrolase